MFFSLTLEIIPAICARRNGFWYQFIAVIILPAITFFLLYYPQQACRLGHQERRVSKGVQGPQPLPGARGCPSPHFLTSPVIPPLLPATTATTDTSDTTVTLQQRTYLRPKRNRF